MDKTENLIDVLRQIAENIRQRPYPAYKEDDILGNQEVCTVLHCSLRSLDEYVSSKNLPCHKAGKERLFFYGEVVAWLRSRTCVQPEKEPRRSLADVLRGVGRKPKNKTKKAI